MIFEEITRQKAKYLLDQLQEIMIELDELRPDYIDSINYENLSSAIIQTVECLSNFDLYDKKTLTEKLNSLSELLNKNKFIFAHRN